MPTRPHAGARRFARDAGALGLGHAAALAVPLLTLPYLARVLGPGAWGEVAAALALGNLFAAIPAYGFDGSATRAVARHRGDEAALRAVVSGTAGARGLLTVLAAVLFGACLFVPGVPLRPDALGLAALAYLGAQGVSWGWCFEGLGRFRAAGALAVLARAPVPLLVVLFVRGPDDAARVPLVYAACSLAETLAGGWLARSRAGLDWPRWAWVAVALRDGRTLFAGRAGLTVYLAGNAFWLRLFAGPAAVGVFSAAEGVARAVVGALGPVSRALLPRMARAEGADRDRLMRAAFAGALGAGVALGVLLWALAPLVPRVLGAGFAPAVGLVRMLAPLPLFVALSQVAGVQGLLARGRDGAVAVLFGLGGAVNVLSAALLAPRLGAPGMALALLLAEAAVTAGALFLLFRPARAAPSPPV